MSFDIRLNSRHTLYSRCLFRLNNLKLCEIVYFSVLSTVYCLMCVRLLPLINDNVPGGLIPVQKHFHIKRHLFKRYKFKHYNVIKLLLHGIK